MIRTVLERLPSVLFRIPDISVRPAKESWMVKEVIENLDVLERKSGKLLELQDRHRGGNLLKKSLRVG